MDETWQDWQEIPKELLDKCECLFDYFSTDEIKYFLPAYLINASEEWVNTPQQFSSGSESLIFHLGRWSRSDFKGFDFNEEQQRVISELLEEVKLNDELLWWFRQGRGG